MRVGLQWARMSVSSQTLPSGSACLQSLSASCRSLLRLSPLNSGPFGLFSGLAMIPWEGKPTRCSQASGS